ncbi:sigma-70 family RNA polymerase sigma factor [Miltoncostaea marina]|uniref:sigma-70 family RNA polymerase sigma factor n=1 Tax=Miltoncostaea marina TaxID=2843215 RepID=UPI001C3D6BDB|nr:sigma-70 family RNA polymerase sigma factor [Miltoncostaea marina]
MDERDRLAGRFEQRRGRLRAVAYRMLGSLNEADDAVQEAWLRLDRGRADEIEDLDAWLTTVVGRISLNMLRARASRREQPLGVRMADPVVDPVDGTDPEHEALVAGAVGLAMHVVLDQLGPAERLAYVLHDMFAVPFDDVATVLDRSPDAARQLASRARRRVREATPVADADAGAGWEVVDAFIAAAREGDLEGLVAVLDPDVVLRADLGPLKPTRIMRGAQAVAKGARSFQRPGLVVRPALVNGAPGAVSTLHGEPFSAGSVVIRGGRIVAIDLLADPERLRALGPFPV